MRKALLLAALTCAAAAGCGTTPPALRVAGVQLAEETDEGVALTFTIEATNLSNETVHLENAHYDLSLGGRGVFRGVRSAEATLAANTTVTFTLPASMTWEALGVAGADSLRSRDWPYVIAGGVEWIPPDLFGEVLYDTGVRKPKAPFEEAGRLSFSASGGGDPAAPPASLDDR